MAEGDELELMERGKRSNPSRRVRYAITSELISEIAA